MKSTVKKNIIVTGSSGYVASHLLPILVTAHNLICIDTEESKYTNIVGNIAKKKNFLKLNKDIKYVIVNLASARNDFNITAESYYDQNVINHNDFLCNLNNLKIEKFIHISSVAAFDGEQIQYSSSLKCDDAYRATKYLQGRLIKDWCKSKKIRFVELLPSAIYDDEPRKDTNIGKLQSFAKFIPFIPKISVRKSLTYMNNFVNFIASLIIDQRTGSFLTIEQPVNTVTEIIELNTKTKLIPIKIPFLKQILFLFSYLFLAVWKITKIDVKLYPNRVTKLFKDTSYDGVKKIDRTSYQANE